MNKNIITIESWNDGFSIEPRAGMKPLLSFVSITNGINYTYKYIYTPSELYYILKNISTKKYSLLYLALHGQPEAIKLGNKSEFTISLENLADVMGTRFKGYGIHFASCAVMNGWMENLKEFKKRTGASFISGYSTYVDFTKSSVADHALLSEWIYSRSHKRMFERLFINHKELLKDLGFEFML